MWKICKLDEQLFMGAAAKIHEFLDIEPLMSPGKLPLSKQLGRPLMSKYAHEAVYIEEVKTLDCEVHGYYVNAKGRYCIYEEDARSAPAMHGATITCCGWEDCDVKAFETGWRAKYGNLWPHTRDGPHPALQNLVSAHRAFGEAHFINFMRACDARTTCERKACLTRLCGTTEEMIYEKLRKQLEVQRVRARLESRTQRIESAVRAQPTKRAFNEISRD